MSRRHSNITWCGLALVAAAIVVYAGSLSVPFFFDDVESITLNPHVRSLWPLTEALVTPDETTVAGRPIVALSLAVNYALGGYDVAGYHVWNIACHGLVALLLFGVVRRTLISERLRARYATSATPLAFAVALLWTVHPLQTEAVTWVIQRTELMVSLFFLATLYCAARGVTVTPAAVARDAHDDGVAAPRPTNRGDGWLTLALITCALGMATKEVMVSAPLVVLLWQRTFATGTFRAALRRNPGLYAGLGASWLLLAQLVLSGPRGDSVGFDHGIGPWQNLMTQAQVIVWYLRLGLWPAPLSVWYDWPVVTSLSHALVPGLIVLTLLGLTTYAIVRRSALGFLGGAFFMLLAPTSSFVPIATELAAERRMYLPLAALLTLVVLGVQRLLSRRAASPSRAGASDQPALPDAASTGRDRATSRPRLAAGLAVGALTLVVISAGVTSVGRVATYGDMLSLWSDTVAKQPESHQARFNLGLALQRANRHAEALVQYDHAFVLDPYAVPLLINYGICLGALDREEQAVAFWEDALTRADDPRILHNLGLGLAAIDRPDEAVTRFQQALQHDPDYADAHCNLAVLFLRLERLDEAAEHLTHALRVAPDHPEANALLDELRGA